MCWLLERFQRTPSHTTIPSSNITLSVKHRPTKNELFREAPAPSFPCVTWRKAPGRPSWLNKYFFALSSQSTIGPNYFNPLVATQMRTTYGSDLGFSKLFLRLPKSYSNKHVQGFWHSPPQSPIHRPINNRNAQNSLGSLLCIVRQKFKTLMNVVKREKKM